MPPSADPRRQLPSSASMSMRIIDPVVPDVARDLGVAPILWRCSRRHLRSPMRFGQPILGLARRTPSANRGSSKSPLPSCSCVLAAGFRAHRLMSLFVVAHDRRRGGGRHHSDCVCAGRRPLCHGEQRQIGPVARVGRDHRRPDDRLHRLRPGRVLFRAGARRCWLRRRLLPPRSIVTLWHCISSRACRRCVRVSRCEGMRRATVRCSPIRARVVCFTAVFVEGILVFGAVPLRRGSA